MVIKAQALADFVAKFTYIKSDEAPNTSAELAKEVESEEKKDDTTRWKLFIDGSSNHNDCGVGLILQTSSCVQLEYAIHMSFKDTNNEVEYETLLIKLKSHLNLK